LQLLGKLAAMVCEGRGKQRKVLVDRKCSRVRIQKPKKKSAMECSSQSAPLCDRSITTIDTEMHCDGVVGHNVEFSVTISSANCDGRRFRRSFPSKSAYLFMVQEIN